jgi:hypothetical protein
MFAMMLLIFQLSDVLSPADVVRRSIIDRDKSASFSKVEGFRTEGIFRMIFWKSASCSAGDNTSIIIFTVILRNLNCVALRYVSDAR